MYKIAIINSKGGTGKTTVSVTLASYFVSKGYTTGILDFDPQASSTLWAKNRGKSTRQPVQVIQGFKKEIGMTRDFYLSPEVGTEYLIIDFPSGFCLLDYKETLQEADVIIIPALMSPVDVHSAIRFIQELLPIVKINKNRGNIGLIANRVKNKTMAFNRFLLFLETLKIPYLADLCDSQNYIDTFDEGVGIFEMNQKKYQADKDCWQSVLKWLDEKLG